MNDRGQFALLLVIVVSPLYGVGPGAASTISFRPGSSDGSLAFQIVPLNPTTDDVVQFTDPFDGKTYGNNCSALAANGFPIIDVDERAHAVSISFDETNKPEVCTLQFQPVSGLNGGFGPLSAGDWVLQSPIGKVLPFSVVALPPILQPGDANQDLSFDQVDIVQVLAGNKYHSLQKASWEEGDWNGAPGGSQGSPPIGDSVFNQLDVIAALRSNVYLTGPYSALAVRSVAVDDQISLIHDGAAGEVDKSAVPEPATLTFLWLAAIVFLGIRRCL